MRRPRSRGWLNSVIGLVLCAGLLFPLYWMINV